MKFSLTLLQVHVVHSFSLGGIQSWQSICNRLWSIRLRTVFNLWKTSRSLNHFRRMVFSLLIDSPGIRGLAWETGNSEVLGRSIRDLSGEDISRWGFIWREAGRSCYNQYFGTRDKRSKVTRKYRGWICRSILMYTPGITAWDLFESSMIVPDLKP